MKKLSKKSAALLVAGLVTCGLLAGCGGGDKKDAPKDGGKAAAKTLVFGCQMYADGGIDPSAQTNTAWNCSRFGVGQTLFRFDDNVKPVPQLAESATPSDGNKTWTFKLKKGIEFSNGTEMTATKVKEYLDWIREAGKKGSTRPQQFLDFEAVVTADDEYFSSYVANLEVMLEVDEEALELIFTKQFLYPCIVGILHFVTIRGVEQVDDDEFGRVCLERITQELQYLVKSHFCGHDAMISVDVVLIDSRT